MNMKMITDSVEKTSKYKKIVKEVEEKVVAEIGEGGYLGYCHRFWEAKQRILKEEYNMDWKTPAQLNPNVLFD